MGLLLYYFNHHLLSNAYLRVVYLVVRGTKKEKDLMFLNGKDYITLGPHILYASK